MPVDWKNVARLVAESHRRQGTTCISLLGVPLEALSGVLSQTFAVLNITEPSKLLVVKGRIIPAKTIRGHLWEKRRERILGRISRTFLWTGYDVEEDESVMGIAVMVTEDTAERMELRKDYFVAVQGG